MPWVSREELKWLRERDELATERVLELGVVKARLAGRTDQVRNLRRAIHRLRSEVNCAVNIVVSEAHQKFDEPRPTRRPAPTVQRTRQTGS